MVLVRSSHTCSLLALCFCHVALCSQNVHVCKFIFPSPGAEGENTGKEIDPASYRLWQHSVTPNRQTHLQKSESVHSFEFQFCYVVSPLANLMPIESGLALVSTCTVNLRKIKVKMTGGKTERDSSAANGGKQNHTGWGMGLNSQNH